MDCAIHMLRFFYMLVAKRLGHADMTTTQSTYIHIIEELENQDNDKIMRHLAAL